MIFLRKYGNANMKLHQKNVENANVIDIGNRKQELIFRPVPSLKMRSWSRDTVMVWGLAMLALCMQ